MNSENKKLSIKGSKENIKLEVCLPVFLVGAIGGIIIRCMQMVSYIDPETGFYKGNGDWIHLIFYIILAVNILFFCSRAYFSAACKTIETVGQSSKVAAIGTRAMAVGFLFDCFTSFVNGITGSSTAADYTGIMKSGTLPLLLQSLFGLFSAIYFFILASDFSKGTAKAYKRKIMAAAPVCWAGARLIHRFLRQISFVEVSDLFLELIMIAFMIMFFMALAQVSSGVYKDAVKWRIPAFCLSAAIIAATLSIPRMIFTLVNAELIVSEHPFYLSDLLFAVFVLTLIIKIKDSAKAPLVSSTEESEDKE